MGNFVPLSGKFENWEETRMKLKSEITSQFVGICFKFDI